MFKTLTVERNQATLEYDATRFRTLATDLVKGLTGYINDMSRYMSDVFSGFSSDRVGFTQNQRLQSDVKKSSYISLAEVAIPVPVGLNVPMLEYLAALEINQSIIDDLIPTVFKPALNFFSLLVASPEQLNGVTASTKAAVRDFEKEYQQAKASIAKCFITNDRTEYMRYGDVYARHADYCTAQERFEGLTARLSKVPASDVRKSVEDICNVLDRLAIRLRQDPDTYAVSGVNAKFISDIAFSLAVAAEYYAGHFYLMQTLNSTIVETDKKLKTIV